MKKYLLNRVLRSFFSIIMVMILSVVLIFTLIPLDYVVKANEDIKTAKLKGEDAAKIRTKVNTILTMEALEEALTAFMLSRE